MVEIHDLHVRFRLAVRIGIKIRREPYHFPVFFGIEVFKKNFFSLAVRDLF